MAIGSPGPLVTGIRGSAGDTTFRIVRGQQVISARGGGGNRPTPINQWQYDQFKFFGIAWAQVQEQLTSRQVRDNIFTGSEGWRSLMRAVVGAMCRYYDTPNGYDFASPEYELPDLRHPPTPSTRSFNIRNTSTRTYVRVAYARSTPLPLLYAVTAYYASAGVTNYYSVLSATGEVNYNVFPVGNSLTLVLVGTLGDASTLGTQGIYVVPFVAPPLTRAQRGEPARAPRRRRG